MKLSSDKWFWTGTVVACVLGSNLIGRGFVALDPNRWDGQMFSYLGQKWIEGWVPYVDLWDNKPPGIFAVFGSVFALFPGSYLAIAILEATLLMGTSALAFAFLRRLGAPPAAAGLAATTVALACNINRLSPGGMHTEIYTLLPIMLSMWCFARAGAHLRTRWMIAAGFAAGLAAFLNPKGLSPIVAQAVFLALCALRRHVDIATMVRALLACLCGLVLAWTPAALYFGLHGGLWKLIDASALYNFDYGTASRSSIGSTVLAVARKLELLAAPLAAAGVAVLLGTVRWWRCGARSGASRVYSLAPLLGIWFLLDLIGVQAGGRNYYHYYLLPALSVSVTAGYLLWLLQAELGAVNSRSWRAAVAALVVTPLLFGTLQDANRLRWKLVAPPQPGPAELVAEWIRARTSGDQTLFTWDYDPAVYNLTGLDPVTSQVDAHHLYDSPKAAARFGPQVLADLEAGRPDFIVDRTPDPRARRQDDLWYARFHRLLESGYVEAWHTGAYRVFRRSATVDESGSLDENR